MERDSTTGAPAAAGSRAFEENVEAIVIAFILAIIIRQFVLEAFKIPTQSMEPTLMGELLDGRPGVRKPGDRVLVNKTLYDASWPRQWDVAVFKYPYEDVSCRDCGYVKADHEPVHFTSCTRCGSRNVLLKKSDFIKRLVGLPGRRISVRHGDIYIDGSISRKTAAAQHSLWLSEATADFARAAELADWTARGGAWTIEKGSLAVQAGADVVFEYRNNRNNNRSFALGAGIVYDNYHPKHGRPHPVGDLRLTLSMKAASTSGELVMVIGEDDTTYKAVIPVAGSGKGSYVSIAEKGKGEPQIISHAGVLPTDERVEVGFANVDDTLILTIGGKELVRHVREGVEPFYESDADAGRLGLGTASFELHDLAASVWRIKLDKDVYYTNGRLDGGPDMVAGVDIPEDHYFFMGDNSTDSSDSRRWGTVSRRDIVGKAFLIFWPAWPFYTETRIRFVH